MGLSSLDRGRVCLCCGVFLAWSEFKYHPRGFNGRYARCKFCESGVALYEDYIVRRKDTFYSDLCKIMKSSAILYKALIGDSRNTQSFDINQMIRAIHREYRASVFRGGWGHWASVKCNILSINKRENAYMKKRRDVSDPLDWDSWCKFGIITATGKCGGAVSVGFNWGRWASGKCSCLNNENVGRGN